MTLNAAASLSAKASGQQLALDMSGEWPARALQELRAWLVTHAAEGWKTITMEQFRAVALNVPSSHKAWGALPRLACAAGLLEPMTHADGSPVARPAESVRTHGHFVRVWRIASSFSAPAAGAQAATLIETEAPQALRNPSADSGRGGFLQGANA